MTNVLFYVEMFLIRTVFLPETFLCSGANFIKYLKMLLNVFGEEQIKLNVIVEETGKWSDEEHEV